MKKLFILSSISVFIGLMFLVFCTSQVYAQSPFEVPPAGGFPACQSALNICNDGLATCNDVLADCQAQPICGDGTVEGTEDCDVSNLNGATCSTVGGSSVVS